MKSQTILPKKQENKSVKHHVIRGSQNIPYDANVMAHMEQERSYLQQLQKKNKMQSFLNSTKLNASKLYKQKSEKNNEKVNSKKAMLQKQKDLKSKYTMVKKMDPSKMDNELKKGQTTKNIKADLTKVQWKKSSETNIGKVKIPEEKLIYEGQSDGEMSAMDSDIDFEKQSNPNDMLKFRESVRNAMLNKFNAKK